MKRENAGDGARTRNLCLLKVSGAPAFIPRKLADADPPAGSQVYAISNALGFGISISEGVVSALRQSQGESFIQFTAAIAPGSEGGGLFDAEGRLVGLISYQQRDGQNVNFACPARWLGEIAKRATSTDEVDSWRAKAKALQQESKWQELAQLAGKWTEALTDNLEGWLCLAQTQEKLKDWPAAEKAYREMLKREPAALQARAGLAAVLLMQDKKQDALDTARSLLEFRKEDGSIWSLIGYLEVALGHSDAAREAYEHAAGLEPWNRTVLAGLVTLARARNDWNAAVAAQRGILRLAPDDAGAWLELSGLYLACGRSERALASAEKSLELSPANGDALLVKGAALYALKRVQEARAALLAGLALQPKALAQGQGWLGDVYYEQHLYLEAINAYREAVKVAPKDPSLRGRLGLALKDNFQRDEALALFEQLKLENPKDPFPWRQVGYIYGALAQPEQSIPAYEQSLSLDVNQPQVWRALMEAHHVAGREDEVKRAYQRLLALNRSRGEQAYKSMLLPYGVAP